MKSSSQNPWSPLRGTSAAVHRARELRQEMTHAETILWKALRNYQLDGAKFRRQHPVGRYILDFYCPKSKLAIEVDGAVHLEQKEADDARQNVIEQAGIRVIRFTNEEVESDLESVLRRISEAVLPQPLSPSPCSEKGDVD